MNIIQKAAFSIYRNSKMALPSLIVFDLDACLWSPEMYELDKAPTTWDAKRGGVKAGQDTVTLYPGARETLLRLLTDPTFQGCKIAAASSTTEPAYAKKCLEQTPIDLSGERKEKMGDLIKFRQIYPGSKGRTHFPRLQQETGIPYSEMIFFDDCSYSDNCGEVASACSGVTCVRTPNGLTREEFNLAIEGFAKGKKGVLR